MHDLDIYKLLQECDAFIIISPVHWFSLTSQVKSFFDRLVCVNQTLAVDDAKNLMGPKNIKNSEITGKLSKSGKYENMLRNHLDGKVAAFYVHGDDGANDYTKNKLPESYDVISDPFTIDPKSAVLPYIMQMKYSGVFVPDNLVQAFHVNKGLDYYTANKTFDKQKEFKERADVLIENLLNYLDEKD
jgi:multimeric flavodoxin WrbA